MVDTGDRLHIAGNASADGDFVGRDAHIGRDNIGRDSVGRDAVGGNSVHIALERMAEVSQKETDQIGRLTEQINQLSASVADLTRALIGDPRYGTTGLVQRVDEMAKSNERRDHWRQINILVLLLIALSEVAQWWLLTRGHL